MTSSECPVNICVVNFTLTVNYNIVNISILQLLMALVSQMKDIQHNKFLYQNINITFKNYSLIVY